MPENRCLFLQGNTQTGKSTLILNSILPFLSVTAGFMSQRLLSNGETKAFCLTPIKLAEVSYAEYDKKIPYIFLEYVSGKWQRNENIFTAAGVKMLSDIAGKKLIVLDEIGGVELLSEPFRRKLYEVLSCGIPCIGVIKSYCNRTAMQKSIKLKQNYTVLHEKLYKDIVNCFDGIIISTDDNTKEFVETSICTFLDKWMNA